MSMRWFIAAGLCVAIAAVAAASGDSEERFLPNPNKASVEQPPPLPSVNGKYRVLLRKLYMPQDEVSYRRFTDFGLWQGTAYGQFNDLPVGYWVYVYPHWYIWRDLVNPNAKLPPGLQPQPVPPGKLGIELLPDALPLDRPLPK
jgi:hypothetical protein